MLLDTLITSVTTSGHIESARATIKASPKVFAFFSDNTYANKYRAILRELVANAVDAQSLNDKQDDPVVVILPTEADPTLKVVDKGPGMSHSFMLNQFVSYADGSEKSGSNDQVGGFGIGSKSPFAYTDQFALKVTSDGTVRIYTMFRDTDGCPSIALLHRRDMRPDDLTGVEVSFAVEPNDIGTFNEAAVTALAHFKPQPTLVNSTSDYPALDYVATGANWGMRRTAGPLQVVMGGIMYPVDVSSLTYKFSSVGGARNLLNYGLDVTVPIGTCAVALSREALSYDDRTVKALQTVVEGVAAEVAERLGTMFDSYPTKWAAARALQDEVGNSYGPRQQFLRQNAKYNGEVLPSKFTASGATWTIRSAGSNWNTDPTRPRWAENHYNAFEIDPAKTSAIFLWDLDPTLAPSKSRGAARVAKAITDLGISRSKSIEVIKVRPEGIPALLTRLGNPDCVYRVSELEIPARAPSVRGSAQRVASVYQVGDNYGFKNRRVDVTHTLVTSYDLTGEDLEDGGIYVPMTAFTIDDGTDMVGKLATGLIPVSTVYFVNKGDEAKLDKEVWTSFDTAWAPALAAALAADKTLPARLALLDSVLSSVFDEIRMWKLEPLTGIKANTPFGKIIGLYHKYIKTITSKDMKLSPFVTAALPPRVNPAELLEAFKDEQPLVVELLAHWYYRPNGLSSEILMKVI